jgi:RHS repeat-associated protein
MQKTVTDSSVSPNKITITKYAGAFVYTNSYLSGTTPPTETLEFIAHEEGRIRPKKIDTTQALTAANTKYIYDYFMKDHLGNTRMVLTTENQTDLYAATQEPASATKENQLFNNLSSTTFTKPGGFDSNSGNTKVSKVNGGSTSTRIGPSITIKVMAGDTISISSQAWYTGSTQAPPTGLSPIADQLLTLLSNGIVASGGTHGGSIPVTDINSTVPDVLDAFLSDDQPYDNTKPKAFLNWMIVDEEFKKTTSSFHMGAVQVPSITGSMQKQTLTGPANMVVRRNGWLYVYVSNESNQDVYFDDIVINHKRGPVVEMNNYYAFGLEIPGLNSKAVGFGGNADNRRKFNDGSELQSKEFSDGSGLELYSTDHRLLDPQIGRFVQIDRYGEVFDNLTPYNYANNNPVLLNDPTGLISDSSHPEVRGGITITARNSSKSKGIVFADNRPSRKNLNYTFGGDQPYYVHFNPYEKGFNATISKQLVKVAGVTLSVIPIGRALKTIYSSYKLFQKIKDDEAIPETAEKVADYALEKNGASMRGWKGGSRYQNDGREGGEILPEQDAQGAPITYKEYDVWPKGPGYNRGADRVVIGSDNSAYFTNNHYQSFIQIK